MPLNGPHAGGAGRPLLQILFAIALLLSGLLTCALGVRTLIDSNGMMVSFGVDPAAVVGVELLVAVLGSAVLSLGLVVLLATVWVWQGRPAGRTLALLSAVTLLIVAITAWLQAGSLQVLLLDGVRGLILLGLGLAWKPRCARPLAG